MKLHDYIFLIIFSAVLLTGCEQTVNGPAPVATGVNLFNAADGIFAFPGVKAVYIDKVDTTVLPTMQFAGKTPDGETFPALPGVGAGNVASISYLQQASGTYRFLFTNGLKQVLADTVVKLAADSKNTFYVYDDPDHLLRRCHVLHLEESGAALAGQCRFRLLQFSRDLEKMNCFFIREDGSKVFPANLPVDMNYGQHTSFITIDPQLAGGDGNAYLQFFSGTDTMTVKATATIPYHKGRSYAVVVSGLTATQFVQYEDPADPGSTKTVQLNASVSARVRTIN